jgi:hypothetical protein
MRIRLALAAGFGLLSMAMGPSTGAAAVDARIGVAGAVNPETDSVPPQGVFHPLIAGEDIAYKERIVTQEQGQAEILFLDRSSLSLGPNAEVVIDEFIYRPEDGTGKLTAELSKGLLRFIGGALSKGDGQVSVRTPSAVIGIRGGIALIEVSPQGTTRATFLYGQALTLTTMAGESLRISRAGFSSEIVLGAAKPSAPVRADAAELAGKFGHLQGNVRPPPPGMHPDMHPGLPPRGIVSISALKAALAAGTIPPGMAEMAPLARAGLLLQLTDPSTIQRRPVQPR